MPSVVTAAKQHCNCLPLVGVYQTQVDMGCVEHGDPLPPGLDSLSQPGRFYHIFALKGWLQATICVVFSRMAAYVGVPILGESDIC